MTENEYHGPSYKKYVMVFTGLALLTAGTVLVSYTGLSDSMKSLVAFLIAGVKTLMVALIFMHLKYEPRTILVFAVAPLLLVVLFILAIAPDIGG